MTMLQRTAVALVCVLASCSDSNNEPAEDMGRYIAPDPVIDMGPDPDLGPELLGELCHLKLTVSSDTERAAPTLNVTDLTTGQPIELLARSSPANQYFDAPMGHSVEFTVVPSAGPPVAPLVYSGSVDQRCAELSNLEYYTPLGLTLEPLEPDVEAGQLSDVFVDVADGLMFVRGVAEWHAIETIETPTFNVAVTARDEAFAVLPPDAKFTSLGSKRYLAEGTNEVTVLFASPGTITTTAPEQMQTPLRAVHQVDASRLVVQDDAGVVWETTLDSGQRTASWTKLAEQPQRWVTRSSGATWMLDAGATVWRRSDEESIFTDVGALIGAARLDVNDTGTRVLGWFGSSCEVWSTPCEARLFDAGNLSPVEADGGPIVVANARAAVSIGGLFTLVADEGAGVRVWHLESDVLVEGALLEGVFDDRRSRVLADALAVNMTLQTSFVRTSELEPASEEGFWDVVARTDDLVELIESPCRDPLTCERVLWRDDFSGRITTPGATLTLGRARDVVPEAIEDAFKTLDFIKDGVRANSAWSITLDPLIVPSGAPCLPVVDTTVTVERFTPVAKALHCLTWWRS